MSLTEVTNDPGDAPCPREQEVVTALEAGSWSAALRQHVRTCQACADQLLVAEALAIAVAEERPDTSLPDPGRIWLRARLAERSAARARATRLITVVEWLAAATGVAVSVAALAWAWPSLRSWLGLLGSVKQVAQAGAANPTLVIAASAVILMVMVVLDLNTDWLRRRTQ